MDVTVIILLGIGGLFLLLIGTLFGLLMYSGLLTEIVVKAGKPPIGQIRIAYKYSRGSYTHAGRYFTEVTSIAPGTKTMGIYYDDPKQVKTVYSWRPCRQK